MQLTINISDQITKDLKDKIQELDKLPELAHKKFVQLTPVDRGFARRNTKLVGDTIQANYPYAQRLNEGWSKQAPDGMTKPWEEWMAKTVNERLGK